MRFMMTGQADKHTEAGPPAARNCMRRHGEASTRRPSKPAVLLASDGLHPSLEGRARPSLAQGSSR